MQKLKRTYKDSFFRHLFSDRENFAKMYEDTTGKKLDPNFIEYYDTSEMMVEEDFKNDISFLTKDNKLIIMVEHQSTLNENLAYRFLNYYMTICNKHLKETSGMISLHQRKAIKLPTPEVYVMYNGKETLKTDYIDLSNNLESTEFLNFKAKIYDVHFENLSEKIEDKEDILLGYAYVIDGIEQRQNQGMTLEEAVSETLKSCKTEGYLSKYLENEEGALHSMILEELTVEKKIEYSKAEGKLEGKLEGKIEGETEAKLESMKKMIEKGFESDLIMELLRIDENKYDEYVHELLERGEINEQDLEYLQVEEQDLEEYSGMDFQ